MAEAEAEAEAEYLQPYSSPQTYCPKCEYHEAATAYVPPLRHQIAELPEETGPRAEHLLRTCNRCRFSWPEAPLDAEDEDSDAPGDHQT